MSADERISLHLAALFRHGLQADGVRAATDLKGVSEVWPAPGSGPAWAWYLWLTTSPGAYELRLVEAEVVSVGPSRLARGSLALRYFPAPAEPVFACLAPAQQDLLRSPVFDETHTPGFGLNDRIPPDWFNVGTIELYEAADDTASVLMLAADDPLAASLAPPWPQMDNARSDVPAWQLAYPVFDALIGLTSYLERRQPARVICSRRPGAVPDSGLKAALVAFVDRDQPDAATTVDRLEAVLGTDPWQTLCRYPVRGPGETDCRRHRHCSGEHDHHHHDHHRHSCTADVSIPLRCSETWWTLAAFDGAITALPCGCH
ncbi:MAG: hypothetical protein P9C48_14010 [Defluviicoccus sp.]|nr:hypothetical protein [Defluviicoccus sp.]MDG4610234.1 hypothetical protein [Defluviicoccus sp.]